MTLFSQKQRYHLPKKFICGLGFVASKMNSGNSSNKTQANVMLSYPIDEAEELLTTRLATAKLNLSNCEEDLDFLREQITVSQIKLSRI
jgi:hypothetical protein